MLRALPFSTFGEIAALDLEVHVYCVGCKTYRQIDTEDARIRDRCFARAPLRCSACGGPGFPKVRPAELLRVGGPVTLAFLFCKRCAWEIDQAQLDKPPWCNARPTPGGRYCCPGCGGRVDWHIHGPCWRPSMKDEIRA